MKFNLKVVVTFATPAITLSIPRPCATTANFLDAIPMAVTTTTTPTFFTAPTSMATTTATKTTSTAIYSATLASPTAY